MRILLASVLFLVLPTTSYAQNGGIKFGVVTLRDFQITVPDTTASAIILFEKGETKAWTGSGTIQNYHIRVMILKKEGIDKWGSGSLISKNTKPSKLNGATYNLIDGRVVRSELTDKYITQGKYDEMNFVMPNVQKGSIIEYQFTFDFGFFCLPHWTFQHTEPTLWSEYSLTFPYSESLIYHKGFRISLYGDHEFVIHETKDEGEYNRWVMTNLPAFKAEPEMPNEAFYKATIDFGPKLSSFGINFPDFKHWKTSDIIEERKGSTKRVKTSTRGYLKLDSLGAISGRVEFTSYGFAAKSVRDKYQENGHDQYRNPLLASLFLIDKKEILNLKDSLSSCIEIYDVHASEYAATSDSAIFLNPFILIGDFKNPFKDVNRKYPVDFGHQSELVFTYEIVFPDGYKIVEFPKSSIIKLPGDAAKCVFNSNNIGQKILVTINFQVNNSIFLVEDYAALRDFFSKVAAKKDEFILLTKETR